MEFSCSERRWLLPEELGREDIDIGFALGLHVPGTYYKVLDTRACLLQAERGNAILEDVRRFMKSSGIPPNIMVTKRPSSNPSSPSFGLVIG